MQIERSNRKSRLRRRQSKESCFVIDGELIQSCFSLRTEESPVSPQYVTGNAATVFSLSATALKIWKPHATPDRLANPHASHHNQFAARPDRGDGQCVRRHHHRPATLGAKVSEVLHRAGRRIHARDCFAGSGASLSGTKGASGGLPDSRRISD